VRGGIAADAKGRQAGCEHCGDSRCPADARAARKLAAIAICEAAGRKRLPGCGADRKVEAKWPGEAKQPGVSVSAEL
jgi:hypothetical protein